jgi:hypothetical protein
VAPAEDARAGAAFGPQAEQQVDPVKSEVAEAAAADPFAGFRDR